MRIIVFCAFLSLLGACSSSKIMADYVITHAKIYTVNAQFDIAEAMAVKDGKIIAIGTDAEITAKYTAKESIDAQGKPIYPGFIDAHAHFYRYGEDLQRADLVGTKSWEDILDTITAFDNTHTEGWLIGRGWDQNDWQIKEYPNKKRLDELFPNRPVILTRIDGHAAIVNQKALDIVGLKPNQKVIGGEIETKNGELTGILVDNAIDLVSAKMPPTSESQMRDALLAAQDKCFAVGLTTVVDCGLDYPIVNFIEKLNLSNELKMRLFVMLSDVPTNYDYIFKRGKIKTDRLNVRSFKLYADGALGSRGACLLHPYNDRPNHYGFLLSRAEHFDSVTQQIAAKGFQACTHAIGDSANREILRIYTKNLQGKTDQRWRIEHAQVVNPADFDMFGKAQIIPSVQPTHATSDMYWAGERLGKEREKGAYAFKQLLNQNGWIPLGTDFPVEDINPILTFYAATVRKDAKGFPDKGYQMENALSRQEALRGMTIWAAKGNFEEHEKGSLEVGKFADFIFLNQDIMVIPEDKILETQVLKTFIGGDKVFDKKQ